MGYTLAQIEGFSAAVDRAEAYRLHAQAVVAWQAANAEAKPFNEFLRRLSPSGPGG